jgi:lipoic acid synthetase
MNQLTNAGAIRKKKPEWLKTRLPGGDAYFALKNRLEKKGLHTICQNARCPNIHECWNGNQATFLVMGNICSRDCRFCAVASGKPLNLDQAEGQKVLQMAQIRTLKQGRPQMKIEVLVPDFDGCSQFLDLVLDAGPDVLAHNVETVPSLYPAVNRRVVAFEHSLHILEHGKKRGWITKTGVMVGLGETVAEIEALFSILRNRGVDILTMGQYLQPDGHSLPVSRYYSPGEFAALKKSALEHGFLGVESGPFVRSSYHAEQLFKAVVN